jgi:hypothetical protein
LRTAPATTMNTEIRLAPTRDLVDTASRSDERGSIAGLLRGGGVGKGTRGVERQLG